MNFFRTAVVRGDKCLLGRSACCLGMAASVLLEPHGGVRLRGRSIFGVRCTGDETLVGFSRVIVKQGLVMVTHTAIEEFEMSWDMLARKDEICFM